MMLDLADCLTQSAGVLTPYAPTAIGTNINTAAGSFLDRLVPMDDGYGEPLWFYFTTVVGVTSGGAPTISLQLIGNPSDPTFSGGNVVLCQSNPVLLAVMVAGYHQAIQLDTLPFQEFLAKGTPIRYLAVAVVITAAVLTAGSWNAWLTNRGIQANQSYNVGYAV